MVIDYWPLIYVYYYSMNNSPTQTKAAGSDLEVLQNLESMIKTHISRIDHLKNESKKHADLLKNTFINDTTYKLHEDRAKEAARVKSKTRSEILKRQEVATIAQKVKDFKSELKELEGALSDYLREYARLSGTNEIETEDGEIHEIIYIAKLVKKSSRNK